MNDSLNASNIANQIPSLTNQLRQGVVVNSNSNLLIMTYWLIIVYYGASTVKYGYKKYYQKQDNLYFYKYLIILTILLSAFPIFFYPQLNLKFISSLFKDEVMQISNKIIAQKKEKLIETAWGVYQGGANLNSEVLALSFLEDNLSPREIEENNRKNNQRLKKQESKNKYSDTISSHLSINELLDNSGDMDEHLNLDSESSSI